MSTKTMGISLTMTPVIEREVKDEEGHEAEEKVVDVVGVAVKKKV